MRREVWTLAVAAFLLLLFAAPEVRADATRLSFTLCETATLDLHSGTAWLDDAGIYHVRNMAWTSTFEGTFGGGTAFTGEGSGLFNYNVDTTSGLGDHFGAFSWTFHPFRGASEVTFSGRFSGAFTPTITNDLVAHAGVMTLKGHALGESIVCSGSAEPWSGTILIPPG